MVGKDLQSSKSAVNVIAARRPLSGRHESRISELLQRVLQRRFAGFTRRLG